MHVPNLNAGNYVCYTGRKVHGILTGPPLRKKSWKPQFFAPNKSYYKAPVKVCIFISIVVYWYVDA